MALIVGIPRALLYFKYPWLWESFFRYLGAEVVVSSPTNRVTINRAGELAESELCLPLRVFHGHIMELKDKVDALFVPRVVSVEKGTYTCPKFLGLPDIIAALPIDLPRLISPTINLRLGRVKFYCELIATAAACKQSAPRALLAWYRAKQDHRRYLKELLAGRTPLDVLQGTRRAEQQDGLLRVGIVGHAYNLYDAYVNMNVLEMLWRRGVRVLVPEMLSQHVLERYAARLPKKLYWNYEREVVGAVLYWADKQEVDGIIYLRSFSCGPDSIVQVLLDHDARVAGTLPIMSLAIDEHAAETGLVTRVEAFLDMLQRRR